MLRNGLILFPVKRCPRNFTDGKKKNQLRGIPKLDDAIWAGTNKSEECTLILTEGDSAKALIMGGLSGLTPQEREYQKQNIFLVLLVGEHFLTFKKRQLKSEREQTTLKD